MLRDKSAAPALDPSFLESALSPISGTVHDEIILEVPEGRQMMLMQFSRRPRFRRTMLISVEFTVEVEVTISDTRVE
jgi:hypothetical protein